MHHCLVVAAAGLALGTAAFAQGPSHPLLVSTSWLGAHLNDPSVAVLHVVHDSTEFGRGHIPGAREISYSDITVVRDSIGTELPDPAHLQRVFERAGVSDHSHVVVYAGSGMAPMASRVFLTLDYIGHAKVSLLNGGLARWRAESRPVSTTAATFAAGRLTPRPRTVTVSASWMNAHTAKPGYAFIDTRTDPEYLGTGERGGLPSAGHIAGARQLQWQQLFANADSAVFLDSASIASLYSARSAPGDTLVTYCLVGYRASMTYFGARLLGLPVRMYDGSYQDWARRALPVTKGAQP
jgi:thiosulfate/3-mercaptopyruvate sulfurtransferase